MATQTKQLPKAVQEELENLRGFKTLVNERWGYVLGKKAKQAEMNDATKKERKVASEARSSLKEDLGRIIAEADVVGYNTALKTIEAANKVVAKASAPFREKMKPLGKATKYLDTVAIPDALAQIGAPIQPRFSLSDWVQKAIEEEKN